MAAHEDEADVRRHRRWVATRVATAIVIALALAYLPYGAIDSQSLEMLERMKTDIADAQLELASFERENEKLRRDIGALRSDGRAIEEFARRDLGMTRPGEVLIRFEATP